MQMENVCAPLSCGNEFSLLSVSVLFLIGKSVAVFLLSFSKTSFSFRCSFLNYVQILQCAVAPVLNPK